MFLNFFIWGLKLEIQRELLISPQSSLAEAMAKAQLCEEQNDDLTNHQWRNDGFNRNPISGGWQGGINKVDPTPTTQVTSPTQGTKLPPASLKIPFKHIPPATIQAKCDKLGALLQLWREVQLCYPLAAMWINAFIYKLVLPLWVSDLIDILTSKKEPLRNWWKKQFFQTQEPILIPRFSSEEERWHVVVLCWLPCVECDHR